MADTALVHDGFDNRSHDTRASSRTRRTAKLWMDGVLSGSSRSMGHRPRRDERDGNRVSNKTAKDRRTRSTSSRVRRENQERTHRHREDNDGSKVTTASSLSSSSKKAASATASAERKQKRDGERTRKKSPKSTSTTTDRPRRRAASVGQREANVGGGRTKRRGGNRKSLSPGRMKESQKLVRNKQHAHQERQQQQASLSPSRKTQRKVTRRGSLQTSLSPPRHPRDTAVRRRTMQASLSPPRDTQRTAVRRRSVQTSQSPPPRQQPQHTGIRQGSLQTSLSPPRQPQRTTVRRGSLVNQVRNKPWNNYNNDNDAQDEDEYYLKHDCGTVAPYSNQVTGGRAGQVRHHSPFALPSRRDPMEIPSAPQGTMRDPMSGTRPSQDEVSIAKDEYERPNNEGRFLSSKSSFQEFMGLEAEESTVQSPNRDPPHHMSPWLDEKSIESKRKDRINKSPSRDGERSKQSRCQKKKESCSGSDHHKSDQEEESHGDNNPAKTSDESSPDSNTKVAAQQVFSVYHVPVESRTVDLRNLPPPPLAGPLVNERTKSLSPKDRAASIIMPSEHEDGAYSGKLATNDNNDLDDVINKIEVALMSGSWLTLYNILKKKTTTPDKVIAAMLIQVDNGNNGIALHTLVWKAPPQLALMVLQTISLAGLRSVAEAQDGDGNTPLHLCCANWDIIKGGVAVGDYSLDMRLIDHLREMMAPRALLVKNKEGDTPLHLLVSSPACCTKQNERWLSLSENRRAAVALAAKNQVREFVNANEEQATTRDSSGATPLHVAIASGASEEVLLCLIELVPAAVKMKDAKGLLPLHYVAAFGNTPCSVVKELVRAFPGSIMDVTPTQDTPLHLCVSNASKYIDSDSEELDQNTTKCIELLMAYENTENPRQSKLRCPLFYCNHDKLSPLHCCALFDTPPQVTRLLMKHPLASEAASLTNSFGATPLHLAASHIDAALSLATVQAVGTPKAAETQDRLKRVPLHVAAQNPHATGELIQTLIQFNKESAGKQTQRGHLPIHLAAQSQASVEVVKALIEAYPKATEGLNKSGSTALHDAAKYRASAGVVKLLLDTYPESIYIENQYGNLPLHCATAYRAPEDVVSLLLQAWPEGAPMQNRNQDAALHYAAAFANSADAVKPLIEAAPSAVLLLNSSGQSPIDRAMANNAPREIVELLEASAKEWTEKASSDGWGAFTSSNQEVSELE